MLKTYEVTGFDLQMGMTGGIRHYFVLTGSKAAARKMAIEKYGPSFGMAEFPYRSGIAVEEIPKKPGEKYL